MHAKYEVSISYGSKVIAKVNRKQRTVYNRETQTLFIDTKDKAIAHALKDSNKSNAI